MVKNFKFFQKNESRLGYYDRPVNPNYYGEIRINRRRYNVQCGILHPMELPTGMLFYMEQIIGADPVNENVMPEVSLQLRSEAVVCSEITISNLTEFLNFHRDDYIWCHSWKRINETMFNPYVDNLSLPLDEQLTLRCVIR
jgi:hypothetical protein